MARLLNAIHISIMNDDLNGLDLDETPVSDQDVEETGDETDLDDDLGEGDLDDGLTIHKKGEDEDEEEEVDEEVLI
jgi:hypothetical protein